MKVAIYIRAITSAQGTERVSANIAMGLADRGHSVDFLVEDREGWLIDELDAHPNINVIDLGDGRGSCLMHRGFQLWILLKNVFSSPMTISGISASCPGRLMRLMAHNDPSVLSLYRYVRRERPVSVMSFLNQSNIVLLLVEPYLKRYTKILVNVRNHITTSARYGKSKWMRSVPALMKRYFPRADVVLAPSQGVADDVMQITGLASGFMRVIYNPVYRNEITALSEEPPSHKWMCDPDVPVILGAGKLKLQKDFETLLRAFAIVRAKRVVRLVIIGRGSAKISLIDLAETLGVTEDFQLTGHVKNPYAFFACASVFVLSSAWEGLPNVLIEALACGCPVVSTDCPSGPFEILDGGRIGKLVSIGDPEEMAKAIIDTLDVPPDRELLINRAREFSYENSINGYEDALGLSLPK